MVIMVVHDDKYILRIIQRFLLDLGHEVLAAMCGAEALSLLESEQMVELIVSDIGTLDPGEREFLRTVRLRFPDIPVISGDGLGSVDEARTLSQDRAWHSKRSLRLRDVLACIKHIEEQRVLL
jgi:CheY-like chemotaxis protein